MKPDTQASLPGTTMTSIESRRRLDRAIVAITATSLMTVIGGAVLIFWFLGPSPGVSAEARLARMTLGTAIALISGTSLLILRSGRIKLAAYLLIGMLYGVVMLGAVWLQLGVHSAALPLLACLILLSGFIIHSRAAMAIALLAAFSVAVLLRMEATGMLIGPTPTTRPPAIYIATLEASLFLIIGWLAMRYATVFDAAIKDQALARETAEEALKRLAASEAQLRAIVETEPECVKVLAPDGSLLQMNRAGLDMIEADSLDQVKGAQVNELVAPSYRAEFDALNRRVNRGESGFLEFEITGLKGGHRWLETHAVPLRDSNGNIAGLLGVTRDISTHKLAEIERTERERFLRTVTDAIPGVVGYWTDKLVCTFANTGYLNWVGKPPEEMLGREMRRVIGDALFQRNEPYIRAALSGTNQRFELALPRLDGSTTQGLLHYIPDVRQGHVRGFFVIGWDITELKETQQALVDINQQLLERTAQAEAASVAKSRFLGVMSHELRTPMNGILGMAQLLQMPGVADDEKREYVDAILTSGQILCTLLEEILDFSRLEAGKLELTHETFHPQHIIDESVAAFTPQAKAHDLALQATWLGPNQHYSTDAGRLRQMLANLVGNAVKFTEHGFVKVSGSEIDTGLLEFVVTDSGIGIAPDKQTLLFKPFSQADSSSTRKHGGAGLGLAIVDSLARLMGGAAGVESEAGKGSRFWIRIRAKAVIEQ